MAARGASRFYAPVGGSLLQLKPRGAIRIDRGESESEIEPAPVELREGRHEFSRGCTLVPGEPWHRRNKLIVGRVKERLSLHALLSHADFRPHQTARGRSSSLR